MERFFLFVAAFFAFVGVAAGAFGAHYLKNYLDAGMLLVFETGVRYQMYHALGMGLIVLAMRIYPGKFALIAGWSFLAGMVLFSGSLYILSISGIKWLGAITPLGGAAFLLGWASLAFHMFKGGRNGINKV